MGRGRGAAVEGHGGPEGEVGVGGLVGAGGGGVLFGGEEGAGGGDGDGEEERGLVGRRGKWLREVDAEMLEMVGADGIFLVPTSKTTNTRGRWTEMPTMFFSGTPSKKYILYYPKRITAQRPGSTPPHPQQSPPH